MIVIVAWKQIMCPHGYHAPAFSCLVGILAGAWPPRVVATALTRDAAANSLQRARSRTEAGYFFDVRWPLGQF